jgi:hypothetical protein
LFWVKNANIFAKFFGENIFKIITSVLGYLQELGPWHVVLGEQRELAQEGGLAPQLMLERGAKIIKFRPVRNASRYIRTYVAIDPRILEWQQIVFFYWGNQSIVPMYKIY